MPLTIRVARASDAADIVRLKKSYEDLGYTNIKTQYSFIKALDTEAAERVQTCVPRVEPAT